MPPRPAKRRPVTLPPAQAVTVDRVGVEGDGIGRLAGGAPVYLPLTLPGESILAAPLRQRGDGWLAQAQRIESASEARVAPPCPAFGRCGGCVLQHWREADYIAWKRDLLAAALRRSGYDAVPDIAVVRGLPGERRRLDFAIRRDRGATVILSLIHI